MSEHPVERFTLLVLFQAQADRATELIIEPSATAGAPIKYRVEGRWFDMSPPPSHLPPRVVAELGRLAGFAEGAFPKEGTIDVPFSGRRLLWRIRRASPDAACILTPMAES